ncbi:MBL fold metallo-hydrolase [Sorangium sp. So ce1036]|uniref:MBL fold metallo-hydrolase n=1 Tax=Sorangium sp. So ce1036 TaxID=3133328 RepID=UPI003F0484BC
MTSTRRDFLQALSLLALQGCALLPDRTSAARPSDAGQAPECRITWAGGPTMAISFAELTILTDPVLGESFSMGDPNEPVNFREVVQHPRSTPLGGVDLAGVGLVLLSHAHEDHFDQQAWADLDRSLPILLPVADVRTVTAKGFRRVDGLAWGDTRRLAPGAGRAVSITAIPAHHSSDAKIAEALGKGNGYWIELTDGSWRRTIYWTGDSMPTEEVIAATRSRGRPDLLVPHVGGVGATGPFGLISMRASDVVTLARALRPRRVLPIHHSTYELYREPISELAVRSQGEAYRLDLIAAGSTVVYR